MCDPITLMFAAATAGGKLFEGFAGKAMHDRSADMYRANSAMLETQAEIQELGALGAVARGNSDEAMLRRKGEQVMARASAVMAAGNADPTYGSPLMLQGYSASQLETDVQMVQARTAAAYADAKTGAANTRGQAYSQEARAGLEEAAGFTKMVSGIIGAGTSFLYAGGKWASLGGGGGPSSSSVFALNAPGGGSTQNAGGSGYW